MDDKHPVDAAEGTCSCSKEGLPCCGDAPGAGEGSCAGTCSEERLRAGEEVSYVGGELTADNKNVSSLPSVVPSEFLVPASVPRPTGTPPSSSIDLPLTKNERLLLHAYSRSKTLAEAGHAWARARGKKYSNDDSASAAACRTLSHIRRKFAETGHTEWYWEHLGLSGSEIAQTLAAGLRAVRREAVSRRQDRLVVTADGREKFVRDDAIEIVEVGEDWRSRVESAKVASALRGDLVRRSSSEESEPGPRIRVVIQSFLNPNNVVNNSVVNNNLPALDAGTHHKEE